MSASATQRYSTGEANQPGSAASTPTTYPNFRRHLDAEPDRKWQVEVLGALTNYARFEQGWDSYDAPPVRRDAGFFALEILNGVMRRRTPIPQIVPSSVGGVQLEWHEKGIDLEVHVAAPYECEVWFEDHQDPQARPISFEMTDDFSALEKAISLLTSR